MIFDHLRPEEIAYVSMGSFRHMPDLKRCISENFPESSYIYGEFVTGLDGKQRLLRPLRVEQLRFLAEKLRNGGLDQPALHVHGIGRSLEGRAGTHPPADLGGLYRHLMIQAFGDA